MSAVLSATQTEIYTPESVHDELREFRQDTNEKFQGLQSELDVIRDLTVTHIKECNAQRTDLSELVKEAREQKVWREVSSRKAGKVKNFIVGVAAVLTSVSTIGAACVYLWSKFNG